MTSLRLPASSRARSAFVAGAILIAAALFTEVILPTPGGGRGVPTAILFSGLVQGSVTALTAAGLILIYRSIRIINFAHTAIGAAGANSALMAAVAFFCVASPSNSCNVSLRCAS